MSRIIVLRALPGLGDFICAIPALRALREHEVTFVGLPGARGLAERFHGYIDHFLPFPGWPGIPEVPLEPERTARFLLDAQQRPADLALQLHGSGAASAGFVQMLGARRAAGFVPAGTHPPGEEWLAWAEDESEVRRPLRLLAHLGIAPDGEGLEFPVWPDEERAAEALGLPRPYACLHPGSSLPDRRWPADRFAAVADALAHRGITPVLTGTPPEAGAATAVAEAMESPAISLVGRTPVGALACVLRDAAVTVTNDTGTSHLAAAVGARSVVVHTVTDPARWAPLDRDLHRPLAGDVTVEAVLAEASVLLARSPGEERLELVERGAPPGAGTGEQVLGEA